jgi:hypothetical protein
MAAAYDECITAIVSAIQALSLTGITSSNVVGMLVGDDESGDGPNVGGYPCIIVSPGGTETIEPVTNSRDDVAYPIVVTIISTENRAQGTNRARNLLWRQSIRRKFSQQRLAGITAGVAWKCEVRPGQVADRPRWIQNQHAQMLVITVFVREARG